MLSSREQSAALRFSGRRRVAALTTGRSDGYADAALPKERSIVIGLLIALLATAATAAYGWLAGPPTDPLPRHGTVHVAGGTSYVVMIDGIAHPALNTASALLAADSITTVDQTALDDAPHGAPVGIPGAPDSLPEAAALTDQPWALCTMPGGAGRRTATLVGAGSLPALAAHQALVLADADGHRWLVVSGRRHAVTSTMLIALGISPDSAVPVPEELLALLATGTPLDATEVPEDVDDVVRRTSPAGTTFLAVTAGGYAPVTPVAAAVLSDGPVAETTVTEPAASVTIPQDWPAGIPQALTLTDLIGCVSSTGGALSALSGVPADSSLIGDADAAAAAVIIRPGTASLVRIPREPTDEYLLVTDSGRAYPIADDAAVRRLGYEPDQAIDLPAAAYAMLPRGPDLSVAAATAVPA